MTTALATRRLMITLGGTAPVRLGSDRALIAAYPAERDPMHGIDAFGGQVASLAPASLPDERAGAIDSPVFCAGALTCVTQAIEDGRSIAEIGWMGELWPLAAT